MKNLLPALVCLGLVGCATIKPLSYEDRQHIYAANLDTVWSESIEMLTQESFPIKSMDKENGLIQTDYNKNQIKDSWMSFARYSLNLLITSIDKDNTRVVINPQYEAYLPGYISSTAYGPKVDSGEWVPKNDKDKMLIDKYFKILDEKISNFRKEVK